MQETNKCILYAYNSYFVSFILFQVYNNILYQKNNSLIDAYNSLAKRLNYLSHKCM